MKRPVGRPRKNVFLTDDERKALRRKQHKERNRLNNKIVVDKIEKIIQEWKNDDTIKFNEDYSGGLNKVKVSLINWMLVI